jgi:hypothetical protein
MSITAVAHTFPITLSDTQVFGDEEQVRHADLKHVTAIWEMRLVAEACRRSAIQQQTDEMHVLRAFGDIPLAFQIEDCYEKRQQELDQLLIIDEVTENPVPILKVSSPRRRTKFVLRWRQVKKALIGVTSTEEVEEIVREPRRPFTQEERDQLKAGLMPSVNMRDIKPTRGDKLLIKSVNGRRSKHKQRCAPPVRERIKPSYAPKAAMIG